MNIVCDKAKVIEGMNIVMKAIPGKTTMAILECVVIEAKDNQIKFIANDLQIGIETVVQGEIKESGSVAVKAKVFFEIIRKLPSDEVYISVDTDYNMKISCGKSKFNIVAKSTEEFPYLPDIVREKNVFISQFTLKDIIRQTVFSISDNENAKVMTGELFEIHGSELKVVSLDGHRISIRKVQLKESYDDVSVIIPGKTLIEISKIINGGMDDEVSLFFTDKHVLFEFDDTLVLSRLIEGEYYKIEKMLSSDYETKIKVNKNEMLDCIDRTTLLLKESDKKPVIIDVQDEHMGFTMNSSIGSMDEDIDAVKEGKDILIGFNPRFLIDALRVIDEEDITMYMINPKAPCFIKDDEETYIYLILPVNFNV
ncbi:MAG: DNA polymerase III subunit beta [Lachnospiraceae bacterium]|nr:DNA polymerase III subunit beta [Lachnospiraceae bacterium]